MKEKLFLVKSKNIIQSNIASTFLDDCLSLLLELQYTTFTLLVYSSNYVQAFGSTGLKIWGAFLMTEHGTSTMTPAVFTYANTNIDKANAVKIKFFFIISFHLLSVAYGC